jgi:hypothetical protein
MSARCDERDVAGADEEICCCWLAAWIGSAAIARHIAAPTAPSVTIANLFI